MVQCDLLGRQTRSLLTFEIRTHLTLKVSIEGMTGQVGSETKAFNRGLVVRTLGLSGSVPDIPAVGLGAGKQPVGPNPR